MDASKRIKSFILIICLFILTPATTNAQKRNIQTVIAKVINIDTGIFNNEFTLKTNIKPRQYYYAVYHLRVVSSSGDTLTLGYVFDIKKQTAAAMSNFGVKKDSIYQFNLYKLELCNSDFPLILGCSYKRKKSNSIYTPQVSSIIKQPYKHIYSILDYSLINSQLWEVLVSQ